MTFLSPQQKLRIDNDNVQTALVVTNSPSTTTPTNQSTNNDKNSSNNNTPFLSNLRNSLTYGKKHRKLSINKVNDKQLQQENETKNKKDRQGKKEKKSKDKNTKDSLSNEKERKKNTGLVQETSGGCGTPREDQQQRDGVNSTSLNDGNHHRRDGQEDQDGDGPDAVVEASEGNEAQEGSEEKEDEAEGRYMEGLQPVAFSSVIGEREGAVWFMERHRNVSGLTDFTSLWLPRNERRLVSQIDSISHILTQFD